MDKNDIGEQNHSNQHLVEEGDSKNNQTNEDLEYEGDFVETAETRILRFLKDCFNLRVHISNGKWLIENLHHNWLIWFGKNKKEKKTSHTFQQNIQVKRPFGEDYIYLLFQNNKSLKDRGNTEKTIREYINRGADINFKNKYQENVLFEVFEKKIYIE